MNVGIFSCINNFFNCLRGNAFNLEHLHKLKPCLATQEFVPSVPCSEGPGQDASPTRRPGAGDRLEFHGGVIIPKHVRSLAGVVPELG